MKKVMSYALMLPALACMLFACSEVKTDVKDLDGKWNIMVVKGEKVLEEGLPQMEFNIPDQKIHGNTGCNIFNSSVVLDPSDVSAITIAPAATTMMACPNMDEERQILDAMDGVTGVKAGPEAGQMSLVDDSGNVLLVLSKN
ncbi:MAG: META domain-containing protein [Tannerellaceae bacterium]